MHTAAVVLSAGSGKRMGSRTKKQYMQIGGKPIIYYALKAFEDSFVDEIILVSFCQKEIVDRYGFSKVKRIVEGGKERYHSVFQGIMGLTKCDYVFIHDGARPMIKAEMLERLLGDVTKWDACVAGMPAKDTIKIADENGNIAETPNRNLVWTIQTPQVFEYELIKKAYAELIRREDEIKAQGINITDDAMVVETLTGHPVHLTPGSYENIKITTPEDLLIAEQFLAPCGKQLHHFV